MTPDTERNAKRLDYVAYANLTFGALSFLLWALPGPWAIQTMWQIMDRMQSRSGGPSAMIGIMNAGVVVIVVLFWLFSTVSIVNGYLILKRRRLGTCFVLSCVSIFGTLFGVVVGIISLAVLSQDWARDLFTGASGGTASDTTHQTAAN